MKAKAPYFAERCSNAWKQLAALGTEAQALKASNQSFEGLLGPMNEILGQVFQSPSFSIAASDDGRIHFELECNFDQLVLFEEKAFVDSMPEGCKSAWAPSLGTQPMGDFMIEMGGEAISTSSIKAALHPVEGSSGFQVTLFSPQLFDAYARDGDSVFGLAWTILSQILGEIVIMAYIDTISIEPAPIEGAFELAHLKAAIAEAIAPNKMVDTAEAFLDSWTTYRLGATPGAGPRENVALGSSCYMGTVNDYYAQDEALVQQAAADGVSLGFVRCEVSELAEEIESAVDLREALIGALEEEIGPRIFRLIGAAVGEGSVFVDVLVWDYPGFLQAFPKAFSKISGLENPCCFPYAMNAEGTQIC